MTEPRTVDVEIQGQKYSIRSALDQEYVRSLAAFLDQKIATAAESTTSSDSLRLTVLAALNLADELFRLRDASKVRDGQIAAKASELEAMLDRVLMDE